MSRVSIPGDLNRIELPTSPAIFLRGVVYAANSKASNTAKAAFSEEEVTRAEGTSFPSSQDS